MSDSDSDSGGELGIFQDPEGYYKPEPEPTFVTHTLLDGRELKLRLVGHNPLWVGGCLYKSIRFLLFCYFVVSVRPFVYWEMSLEHIYNIS